MKKNISTISIAVFNILRLGAALTIIIGAVISGVNALAIINTKFSITNAISYFNTCQPLVKSLGDGVVVARVGVIIAFVLAIIMRIVVKKMHIPAKSASINLGLSITGFVLSLTLVPIHSLVELIGYVVEIAFPNIAQGFIDGINKKANGLIERIFNGLESAEEGYNITKQELVNQVILSLIVMIILTAIAVFFIIKSIAALKKKRQACENTSYRQDAISFTLIQSIEWNCSKCGYKNDADAAFCSNCGEACSPNEVSSVHNNSDTLTLGWVCSSCNNMNSYYDYHCPVCNAARPSSIDKPTSSIEKPSLSSWTCAKCKTINSSNSTSCIKCGESRTENYVISSVANNEKKIIIRVSIVGVCIISIIGLIVFLVFNLSKPNWPLMNNTSSYSSSSKSISSKPTVRVKNYAGIVLEYAIKDLKYNGAGDSSVKYYYPYYSENGNHIENEVAEFFFVEKQYVEDDILYLECSCGSRISGVINSGWEKSVIRKKIAEVYGDITANSIIEIIFGE